MMQSFPWKLLFPSLLFLLFFQACKNENQEVLRVAVAANARYAMEQMAQEYKAKFGSEVELVFSSSGKLTAQIVAGAPFDVFVSADTVYPQSLFRQGFTRQATKIYGYGTLVLFTAKENAPLSLNLIGAVQTAHIALANPESAPYGKAALEVLEKLNAKPGLSDKLVYGESIAQTTQFILSGAADIGFTAKAVVVSQELWQTGSWIQVPDSLYSPIAQGAVIIDGKKKPHSAAQQFYNFLYSEKGREIWESYGYDVK